MNAARERLREAGGEGLLERLDHLDAVRAEPPRHAPAPSPAPPRRGDTCDADVIVAGGGLWSLVAPLLARAGLRVVVVERARAGQAHREWNASGRELEALVRAGIVDGPTLERLVVARYDHGTCRFHGGGAYPVRDVLDHAVDAGPLLAHARASAEALGVRFLDGHTVNGLATSDSGVRVLCDSAAGEVVLTARILVDARGASSPFASADLVCPTVGGVFEGLAEGEAHDEMNPRVGEILATVDGIDPTTGRQHVWEGFPGHPGQTTVYLFYYARATERVSLAELYVRFFETLPSYKRGDARLVRPTFGFIPGWSRLGKAPASNDPRIVLVGDAAARHSPLTYCGFGATLRSLERCAADVAARVESPRDGVAVDDAPIHTLTGALAHMMAARVFSGDALNDLLDASFKSLYELGEEPYAALLRDEMAVGDFVRFLRKTAAAHPRVWGDVMRGLGPLAVGRWGMGFVREVLRA